MLLNPSPLSLQGQLQSVEKFEEKAVYYINLLVHQKRFRLAHNLFLKMKCKRNQELFVCNAKRIHRHQICSQTFSIKFNFIFCPFQNLFILRSSRKVRIWICVILNLYWYLPCLLNNSIEFLFSNILMLLNKAFFHRRLIEIYSLSLSFLNFIMNETLPLLFQGFLLILKFDQFTNFHYNLILYNACQLPPYNQICQKDMEADHQFNSIFFTFDQFKKQLGSWQKPLEKFLASKTFQNIYKYVKAEYQSGKKIYPKKEHIFNAFKTSPIHKIKVCIVGQDPYHQPNQAHGLCFSVLKPVPPPPSLKNIYKNLTNNPNIQFKTPSHGDLSAWAEQGVFLLNASLTVQDSKPNSHAKCGWQKFTDEVIQIINRQCKEVVFLLWGKPAQDKAKSVNSTKHLILKTSHPSPLSASQGFLTSTCFSDCNNYLIKTGRQPINWNL